MVRKILIALLTVAIALPVAAAAASATTSLSLTGTVGNTSTDPGASAGNFYMRYTGNPAPAGYTHAYQWASPAITCTPRTADVTFAGTIDVSSMAVGDVAFIGLLDNGLLSGGFSGYQSGAYAYIYRLSTTQMRIGPTDGNLGGSIIHVSGTYPFPAGGTMALTMVIGDGTIDLTVDANPTLTDTYGFVTALNNDVPVRGAYTDHPEFANGATPGWDSFTLGATISVPYALTLTGCTAAATGYVFPSTNQLNKDKLVPGRVGQDAPFVELVTAGVGSVELKFTNFPAPGLAYFEYRIDGAVLTSGDPHPVVIGDYEYPGICLGAPCAAGPVTHTFSATTKVEVRLALGGERDWDFDWTEFDALPGDATAPVIDAHDPEVAEATGPSGAVVTYAPPATSDDVDGPGVATCLPASGSTFPIGITTVLCDAQDAAGNDAIQTSFTVTVEDTTGPAFTAPANITVPPAGASGAVVTYVTPSATDAVDGTDPVNCLPASGSTFPIGATTVTCTSTDAAYNTTSHTFAVTVLAAKAAKQSVLAQLQAQGSVNKDTDKKIADATSHLNKSINSSAWVDGNHLRKGPAADMVFNEEKETVRALGAIKNPSTGLAASISSWVNTLVAADRTLATTAISEGGSPKALATANNELAKGDADSSRGKYDTAIDHYKNAWKALKG